MTQIAGPQFNCHSDYDCIINAVFPDVQCFVRMKQDPYYKAKVMPDHENFADTQRSRYGQHNAQSCKRVVLTYTECLLDGSKITFSMERQSIQITICETEIEIETLQKVGAS